MERLPDIHDDNNSPRFDLRNDGISSPPKLPLDQGLLPRDKRMQRAETIYSPRTVMSTSSPRTEEKRDQQRDRSVRRSRQSRSPRRRNSPSRSTEPRSASKDPTEKIEKLILPKVLPEMSVGEKVAVEIIAKVRKQNRATSPHLERPLTSTEIALLNR